MTRHGKGRGQTHVSPHRERKRAEVALLELDEFADDFNDEEGDFDGPRPPGSSKAYFHGRDLGVMVNARPMGRFPLIDD